MKILFFANTEWYLYNFRLPLAERVLAQGHEVVAVTPPGPYGAKLEAAGIRWIPLKMGRRSVNPLSELPVLFRLANIVREEAPDLIHNFTIKSVVYGAAAAKWAKTPAIVSGFDGLGYVFASRDLRARMLAPAVGGLIRLACSGRNNRSILQNKGDQDLLIDRRLIDGANIRLLPGGVGVDTETFQLRRKAAVGGKPTIVFASRLLREKGIVEFVTAAKQLSDAGLDAHFIVAGTPDPGNPGSVTEAELAEWRGWGILDFIGHYDDMPELLQRADIVVLVTAYGEGAPRILMEAAASGVPVIASDHPACRQVVTHGETGLLVPSRDAEALATAMQRLLEDPELRAGMGQKARQKMETEFDERIVINRTLDVYREILPAF
jgi:glycosyltransferase involved in cell wall biosynthesis